MHFCSTCQNMYYIRIDSENTNNLIYYCRNCGNEDNLITNDSVSILKTHIKKNEQEFAHFINKYTKLDQTLPRINKILIFCFVQICLYVHVIINLQFIFLIFILIQCFIY